MIIQTIPLNKEFAFFCVLGDGFCGKTDEAREQLWGAVVQEAAGREAAPAAGLHSRT